MSDQDDIAMFAGMILATVGFLLGLGFFAYPLSRIVGRPATLREGEEHGPWRYFRLCTDHKVVALQYFVAVIFFFFVGGLNAMFIRAELTHSNATLFQAGNYLTLVSLHGTMMLMMMSAAVLGAFGNWLVPIMVGARRMAFPRVESLTLWLTVLAGLVLLSAIFLPGFGIVLELLPVFTRKPLWGYRVAVAGMFGVALLSFMVWQHHLFVSGINANLRPFYMFTTELISIPTGIIFLIGIGTLWRGRIRFTVPMLFSLAFFFNF